MSACACTFMSFSDHVCINICVCKGGDVLRRTQIMLESQVGASEKWQLAKIDLEEAGIRYSPT